MARRSIAFGVWGRPGLEGHALCELDDDLRVQSISLGSPEERPGELRQRSGVGDHDLDPLGPVQSEGEIEAVVARRLEDDPCVSPTLGHQGDELAVSGPIVRERKERPSLCVTLHDHR